jgi:hypothetical protein
MKKNTLMVWVDAGLFALLGMTILSALIEIFLPLFIHVILGLLLSAGAMTHVVLHWDWIKNVFKRFGHLSSQVQAGFLLNLGLFFAYSAAGGMGLIARLSRILGPLHHVVGFFHVFLVVIVIILQIIHLARHWKWLTVTAPRLIGLS